MVKIIFIFGILTSLIIRVFFISQSVHTADIYLMYNMGAAFLEGRNPYLVLDFNNYPPLAIFLEGLSMKISAVWQMSFVAVFKLWPNLADFICSFLIYKFLVKIKVKPPQAALWSVFYLLNPISILISSAHGQLDSITSMLTVLAIYLITFSSKKTHTYFSALSLGIALAIKPNPAMLIPLFILYKNSTFKQKITYLGLILSPLMISFIPFIVQNPVQILTRTLTYSGIGDISYAAILRGLWYQHNAQTTLPLAADFLSASKFIFLYSATALIMLLAGWKHLAKACLIIYLLFLTAYFGIASQYLVWIIPLAILERDKRIFIYAILGAIVLISFYLFFAPDILLGKLYSTPPYQTKHIYLYFLANVMLWSFNLWWLAKIISKTTSELMPKMGLIRKKLILVSFALFFVSLLPMIYFLNKLYNIA